MPYNYHYDLATNKAKVIFKLMFRWRGSLWRAVYVEYLIWLAAYAVTSCIYRFALNEKQQGRFESYAAYFDKRLSDIPLDFMLGFFVTVVVNRWVTQFANLGMIDKYISLAAVDDAFDDIPEVSPDMFWQDTVSPLYSQEMAGKHVNFYVGSANKADIEETVIANNNKPRSSTDIGHGPWRTASYLNPAFTVEKGELNWNFP
ncbi:hypothetical protein TELCIR_18396, partial [Teladorsagia circumcincta]